MDEVAGQIRRFTLCYWPSDSSAEMIDDKTRRVFLKRTQVSIKLAELFIGSRVNVYSRLLEIVGFADDFTQRELKERQQRTLLMVKPDAITNCGAILSTLTASAGLTVVNARMARLSMTDAREFYREHAGREFYDPLCEFMTSGPVLALEVVGANAISKVRTLIGPTDSGRARGEAPDSLRARFGTDGRRNAVHASDSEEASAREISFFFAVGRGSDGKLSGAGEAGNTLCVIKPHILAGNTRTEGGVGDIIEAIYAGGYNIVGLRTHTLNRACAEEFLEVYKGVVAEYLDMVQQFCAGPLIAIEVAGRDAASSFRKFCGPADPEIARHLRPESLRARFGLDKIRNAVHCTDLAEDGPLELQYFFDILR